MALVSWVSQCTLVQPAWRVLDQAHKQGVELPWSCRAGICGSCKQTLLEGEVDHPDAPAITAAEPRRKAKSYSAFQRSMAFWSNSAISSTST